MGAVIGQGGMGVVRAARQVSLDREVAVKTLLPGRQVAAGALLHEARIAGALEHPNMVPIHGIGRDDDDRVLIVMKRVSGTSWRRRLRHGPVDRARELRVLIEVCRAAHYAHQRGVVHRDLKPSNVMLGDFGEVYVLDWGLAVTHGERRIAGVERAEAVRGVAGTPAYMAPEMALPSDGLDERVDVFLLGACLYDVLTGHAPYQDPDAVSALHLAHRCEPPVLPDDVDPDLAAIVRKAMARDREARFESAGALGDALATYLVRAPLRSLIASGNERLARIPSASLDDSGDLVARRAFDEARFSFEQVRQGVA